MWFVFLCMRKGIVTKEITRRDAVIRSFVVFHGAVCRYCYEQSAFFALLFLSWGSLWSGVRAREHPLSADQVADKCALLPLFNGLILLGVYILYFNASTFACLAFILVVFSWSFLPCFLVEKFYIIVISYTAIVQRNCRVKNSGQREVLPGQCHPVEFWLQGEKSPQVGQRKHFFSE